MNNKGSNRIHIILDATKAKRCDWCGSPQSRRWSTNEKGTFCSSECIKAANSEERWTTALAAGCSASFFVLAWIWLLVARPWVPSSFFFLLLGLTLFFVVPLSVKSIIQYNDHRFALEVPKGSRRDIGVSEFSLLQRVSAPVECPNCDANLDLSEIKENMVYHCKYCGASGIIEIVAMKE